MPAGLGKRCTCCYWRERNERTAGQLVQLITKTHVQEAFLEYAAWLSEDDRGLERRTRRLREHAQFFVALGRLNEEPWNGEFLLKNFSTAALRRFELPVKWLENRSGSALSDEAKRRAADLRRIRDAIDRVDAGTLARQVIEAFAVDLIKRHEAGKLSVHSARLALRPAISLLEVEDATGARLPSQAALELYLDKVPGQRAAVSTFLGFLRAKHGLELRLPPKQTSSASRKALERQIAAMIQGGRPADKRWIVVALRYFHHLSAAEAKAIHTAATSAETSEGVELSLDGSTYWIPKQPVLPLLRLPGS